MNAALGVLWWLQLRAKVRRLVHGLRTLRGAIFSLLGLVIVLLWFTPALWLPRLWGATDPALVVAFTSTMILLMLLAALCLSERRGPIYFTLAEIDFLFPGPFTRRALLAYKVATTAAGLAATAVLISLSYLPFVAWWFSAWTGTFCALVFVQLVGMAVGLATQTVVERAYTRARRMILFGIGVLLAAGMGQVILAAGSANIFMLIRRFRASAIGSFLLTPLDLFGLAIAAPTLRELVWWGGLGLAVNAALLVLVLWLDVRWEEAALAASRRTSQRLEQIRRAGGAWAWTPRRWRRWRPPMMPWLGGTGPIAWRQLTTLARHPGSLAIMAFYSVMILGPGLSVGGSQMLGPALVLLLGAFLGVFLQYDFRGDLDHLSCLKMLPFASIAVAAGELAAPVLVTTGVQFILLGVLAALADASWDRLLLAGAFAAPVNVLLYGVQNLLFLLFPARMAPASVADLQHFGRLMVLWALQGMALLACAGLAGLTGLLGSWLAGWSWPAGLAGAWAALIVEGGAVLGALAWVYGHFDVSQLTPP